MKKLIAIALTAAMVLGLSACNTDSAETSPAETTSDSVTTSGTCGENLTWELKDGVLTISGTGKMTDPPIIIWHTGNITKVVVEDGCTSIGMSAFSECNTIESVILPDSVETIESYAFFKCTSLKDIKLPANLRKVGQTAFAGTGVEYLPEFSVSPELVLPETTTTQKPKPPKTEFKGQCGENLTWELDSSTLRIKGTGDMYDFEKLGNGSSSCPWNSLDMSRVIIDEGCTSIGDYAFWDCMSIGYAEIPSTVTKIGNEAFRYTKLSIIKFPDSLTEIGAYAFSSCKYLTDIKFGNGLKKIGECAFSSCTRLETVEMTDSVTDIGDYAFSSCHNLENVKLSGNISDYGQSIFQGCNKLAPVYIQGKGEASGKCGENLTYKYKDGVLTISGTGDMYDDIDFHFSNDPNEKSLYEEMHKLIINEVIIEEGCTSVGAFAFSDSENIKSVTLPSGITYIGMSAFNGCRGLTSINIPDGVKKIDGNAFNNCTAIEDLVIPDSAELPFYDSQFGSVFYNVKHVTYHGPSKDPTDFHWGALSMN